MSLLHPRTMRKRMQRLWSEQHAHLQAAVLRERVLATAAGRNTIADLPSLARQLADPADATKTWGANDDVEWRHEVWAVNPNTGGWYLAAHTWTASPKARAAERGPQKCLVCSGDKIDGTTSVATFMPDLERDYADDRIPFADVPMGLHNAGKKWAHLADGKGFATLRWVCTTHGEWSATMNNRTAEHGGTGCPDCGPRGMSKEQVRVACHIRRVLPDLDIDPDPLDVPTPVREATAWRTSVVRPDMVSLAPRVIVEYDGEYGHSARLRPESVERVRRQTEVLLRIGYDVIRLSIDPQTDPSRAVTTQVDGRREMTVTLPSADPHMAAVAALDALEELTGETLADLADWRQQPDPVAEAVAAREITRLWGASGKRRRERNAKGRTSRRKHIAPGTRFGRLTVTDGPAKFSGTGRKPKDHLVPCHCDCGADVYVPAVDLRRTRNPKRHCARSCPLIPRPIIDPLRPGESATSMRQWAIRNGIPVSRSGCISADVTRLYRESADVRPHVDHDQEQVEVSAHGK